MAGEIEDFEVHPTNELQAAFRGVDGNKHIAIKYEADFSYTEVLDLKRVVDKLVELASTIKAG